MRTESDPLPSGCSRVYWSGNFGLTLSLNLELS